MIDFLTFFLPQMAAIGTAGLGVLGSTGTLGLMYASTAMYTGFVGLGALYAAILVKVRTFIEENITEKRI